MFRRCIGIALCAATVVLTSYSPASAFETLRIGLVLPMTGPLSGTGKQIDQAVRLYLEQNGDTVDDAKIEVLIRDDEGRPDRSRQAAQELITREKVHVLAGFATSPAAVAAAPLATQAKIPEVVMGAQTSLVTERSPFIVRTGATLAQSASTMAIWAAKHGLRKVAILVSDYAPGVDALQEFKRTFVAEGGTVLGEQRIPLSNADLAPPLEAIKAMSPDAMFLFVPADRTREVLEAFSAHGLAASGIKVIGPGDITDGVLLKDMGEDVLGVITAHFYSAAHPSHVNGEFVDAYQRAYGEHPGFVAVAAYDGIHMVCQALRETRGKTNGEALLKAMKGMTWESPRGPMTIDPETREVVQNIYIRKVETVDGENANVEFATFEAVKDPDKSRK